MTNKSISGEASSREGTERRTPTQPKRGDDGARKRRKDARPAELIDAGLAEFALRGYAATRLEDVAKRAGVVKGTIYRYFADKEALFVAAVRSRITPVVGEAGDLADAYPGPTRDLVEAILRHVYARFVQTELRVILRIIIAESANFPQLAAFYHREAVSQGKALIERVIERGLRRGEVRPNAAARLPLVIMAPTVMAAMWKLTFDELEPLDVERFLEAHLALLDEGVFVQESEVRPNTDEPSTPKQGSQPRTGSKPAGVRRPP